jgi:hypothetical protein
LPRIPSPRLRSPGQQDDNDTVSLFGSLRIPIAQLEIGALYTAEERERKDPPRDRRSDTTNPTLSFCGEHANHLAAPVRNRQEGLKGDPCPFLHSIPKTFDCPESSVPILYFEALAMGIRWVCLPNNPVAIAATLHRRN